MMNTDHISALTTYVIWSGEHLWNVSVLQRVHLANLAKKKKNPFCCKNEIIIFGGTS
jgi:hypothetical protein